MEKGKGKGEVQVHKFGEDLSIEERAICAMHK